MKRKLLTRARLLWWQFIGNTDLYFRLRLKELLPLIREHFGDDVAQRLIDADGGKMAKL
jgi:hypothetical protein